jgi:hypothetical protein
MTMSLSARAPRKVLVARHSALVRVTHWLNAGCLFVLLLSGLQIFNAHPSLYWGQYGADHDPAILQIGTAESGENRPRDHPRR